MLLTLRDVTQLCEPPPGDTQVRGQLVLLPPQPIEVPRRLAVFLRAGDYVLELPQVLPKKVYVLCHLPCDQAQFKAIPIYVEFYAAHGHRPRWHRTEGSLQELVRARMETGDVAGQQLERMSLERLRKILGADVLGTDGAVGFDAEGLIRRRR